MSLVMCLLLVLRATVVLACAPARSSASVSATKTTPLWLLGVKLSRHDVLKRGNRVKPPLLIRSSASGLFLVLTVGVKPGALLVSDLDPKTYEVLFILLH